MKKLLVLFLCLGLVTGIMMVSCQKQGSQGTQVQSVSISFYSGSPGGTWYPIAVAVAEIWMKEISEYTWEFSHADAGGSGNLVAIQNGIAQVAVSTSASIGDGVVGNDPFTAKTTKVMGLAALNPEPYGLFVWADSGIRRLEDLKGKRLVPLPRGNTTEAITRRVLQAVNLTYDDFSKVDFVQKTEGMNLLRDGHTDAFGQTFAKSRDANVLELAMAKPIYVIDIPKDIQAKIREISPGIFPDILPAGSYRGIDEDINVIGQTLALTISSDLPENLVYLMTKAMVENWDQMQLVNSSLGVLQAQDLAKDVLGTNFHPGAVRYYRERGWL